MSSAALGSSSGPIGHRSCSLVFIAHRLADTQKPHIHTDLLAFLCVVIFVLKLKADLRQSRMTRIMRTILQDGVLFFFVMVGFHVAMMLFTGFGKVINLLILVNRFFLTSWHPSSLLSPRPRSRCTYFTIPVELVTNLDPLDWYPS